MLPIRGAVCVERRRLFRKQPQPVMLAAVRAAGFTKADRHTDRQKCRHVDMQGETDRQRDRETDR